MPRFDGTGPMGRGPGTGRGLGYCNPARPLNDGDTPQVGQLPSYGRGMSLQRGLRGGPAMGRGRMMGRFGRGRRRGF